MKIRNSDIISPGLIQIGFLYPNGSMVVHMLVSTVGYNSFSKKVLGMNLSPVTLGPSCHLGQGVIDGIGPA